MNIEEARKVLWLKSNPRPLGELFDEGYLTRGRLEWAAQKAFSLKLKEAAKILLAQMMGGIPKDGVSSESAKEPVSENSLSIGISLEEARETEWPFQPYKGRPMGSLVESKLLMIKDLGYAIESAWDERVRRAATALLLVRLEQVVKEPAPSAGLIKVVTAGRSYSERRQSLFTLLNGMVTGFFLAIYLALLGWTINGISKPRPAATSFSEIVWSPVYVAAIVVLIGLTVIGGWLISSLPGWISKRLEKEIEEHRRGQEGEERTLQLILQALDGTWSLFRNVQLPGRSRGDLDFVLVGPPGVWVLEVKAFRGVYRNIGEKWEYLQGKKWREYKKSPSRQAIDNAAKLGGFLKADGIKHFVQSAVVWANPESLHSVENPLTAVWTLDRLSDELGNIWYERKVLEAEQAKMIEKLTLLCEHQRKAEERIA